MAIRFNGTVGSKSRVTTGLPAHTANTVVLIMKPASVAAGFKNVYTAGNDDGNNPCMVGQLDGASLAWYEYSGSLLGTSGLTIGAGNVYGVAHTSNGGGTTANGVKMYSRLLLPSPGTTDVQSGTFSTAAFTGTWPAFSIGDSHYSEPANKDIEQVFIYGRVLSQAEIEECWATRAPVGANCLRWLPATGATLAAAYDDKIHATDWATVGTAPTVTPSVFVDLTGTTTFAGMTSAGTAAVDVAGTQAVTLGPMTSSGTAAVDVQAAQAVTLGPMTSSGTGTVDVVGAQAATLGPMTSSGEISVDGSTPAPVPEPAPAPAPTGGGGGVAPRRQRIGIRIDGRLYFVTYQEAAEILARQADEDARQQRAEQSKKAAKAAARLAAQKLKSRVVIEQPLDFPGVDMSIVADRMFRDLRDVYSKQLIEALLQSNLQRKQVDDQAAMAAAELLIYGD